MNVYTYYDNSPAAPEQQARMIKLWAQSWAKHGWSPKLLTRRMAEEHPCYTPDHTWYDSFFAVAHFGKTGLITPWNVMNFGLKPTRKFGKRTRALGPNIYWTTRTEILESKKTGVFCAMIEFDNDLPLCQFPANDPMEVLESPRWR